MYLGINGKYLFGIRLGVFLSQENRSRYLGSFESKKCLMVHNADSAVWDKSRRTLVLTLKVVISGIYKNLNKITKI